MIPPFADEKRRGALGGGGAASWPSAGSALSLSFPVADRGTNLHPIGRPFRPLRNWRLLRAASRSAHPLLPCAPRRLEESSDSRPLEIRRRPELDTAMDFAGS